MNVLIVHRYFWPENVSAFALALGALAQHHLERGDRVTVASAQTPEAAAACENTFGGRVDLRTVSAPIDRGLNAWGRIRNISRLLRVALPAMGKERWDLIYVVSYPPGLAFLLLLVARILRRVRHAVYFVMDNHRYRVPTRPGRAAFRLMQGWTMAMASRVVTLSPLMKSELVRDLRRPAMADRIVILPSFAPESDEPEPPGERPAPVRDLIYAGSHGPGQNLGRFLEMMAALPPARRPMADFFGEGTEKPALLAKVARLGLQQHVRFFPNVSRDAINLEMRRSRFGLVGARPDLFRFAVPSKLASYNCAGLRGIVMCDPSSELSEWMTQSGIGLAIPPDDTEAGARMLSAILDDPDAAGDPDHVRAAAVALYGKRAWLDGIDDMLRDLG